MNASTKLSALRTAMPSNQSELENLLDKAYVSRAFDTDAFHAMDRRDDQLIRDAVLHGSSIKEYVYSFPMKSGGQSSTVTGVSVIGARQLACEYKGIKSRIMGSCDKTGGMFVFRQYDPMSVEVRNIPELMGEPDYYEVIMEVSDIKTGNSIQIRRKETKWEVRRDGTAFDRPYYDVIAESKAFRNGVLNLIPQDIVQSFKTRALQAGNVSTEPTIQKRREAFLQYCAKLGVPVQRAIVDTLLYAELDGLVLAAKAGRDDLITALTASGLMAAPDATTDEITEKTA